MIGPKFDASTNTDSLLIFDLSIKITETFVPVVANILLGIEIAPENIFSLINFSLIPFVILSWPVKKPVGTTIAAFPLSDNEKIMCCMKSK